MSTNFYARKTCGHCDHTTEIHIGQRSSGWAFALHVEPDRPGCPASLDEWRELLNRPEWRVFDEYQQPITVDDLMNTITKSDNGSRRIRRRELDHMCVGHGEGPWDLLVGEFC